MGMSFLRQPSPVVFDPASPSTSDIIVPDSDSEHDPDRRDAKRRRIESKGRQYKAGQPVFILSASLKGPFDQGWVNPWAKNRQGATAVARECRAEPESVIQQSPYGSPADNRWKEKERRVDHVAGASAEKNSRSGGQPSPTEIKQRKRSLGLDRHEATRRSSEADYIVLPGRSTAGSTTQIKESRRQKSSWMKVTKGCFNSPSYPRPKSSSPSCRPRDGVNSLSIREDVREIRESRPSALPTLKTYDKTLSLQRSPVTKASGEPIYNRLAKKGPTETSRSSIERHSSQGTTHLVKVGSAVFVNEVDVNDIDAEILESWKTAKALALDAALRCSQASIPPASQPIGDSVSTGAVDESLQDVGGRPQRLAADDLSSADEKHRRRKALSVLPISKAVQNSVTGAKIASSSLRPSGSHQIVPQPLSLPGSHHLRATIRTRKEPVEAHSSTEPHERVSERDPKRAREKEKGKTPDVGKDLSSGRHTNPKMKSSLLRVGEDREPRGADERSSPGCLNSALHEMEPLQAAARVLKHPSSMRKHPMTPAESAAGSRDGTEERLRGLRSGTGNEMLSSTPSADANAAKMLQGDSELPVKRSDLITSSLPSPPFTALLEGLVPSANGGASDFSGDPTALPSSHIPPSGECGGLVLAGDDASVDAPALRAASYSHLFNAINARSEGERKQKRTSFAPSPPKTSHRVGSTGEGTLAKPGVNLETSPEESTRVILHTKNVMGVSRKSAMKQVKKACSPSSFSITPDGRVLEVAGQDGVGALGADIEEASAFLEAWDVETEIRKSHF